MEEKQGSDFLRLKEGIFISFLKICELMAYFNSQRSMAAIQKKLGTEVFRYKAGIFSMQ